MKRLSIVLLLILIIPVIIILYFIAPTGFSDEKITFVVPLESKQEYVIADLKKQNFIRSPQAFTFIAGLIKFPGSIEAGSYQLTHRMILWQIADTLMNKPYQKWIVLVPGLRVEQVAERLGKKFNWNDATYQEFLGNAQEGYMFPDTYLLPVDYTGRAFAQRLISNYNEKFDAKLQEDLLAQNVRNDTAIKIASLIERESGSDDDKALIAGIIWNRLNTGMRLQIDATVQYALGSPGNWWPRVTVADYKTDSLYNTYTSKGLPPGPIANPSLASIRASVYPAVTDCFFYLHDHNKQIHCALTYEEHLKNIEKYLR